MYRTAGYSGIIWVILRWIVGISTLLWFVPAGSASAELLQDDGFELSTANGSVPDSGFWVTAWHPDTAGTIVTSTAARSGQSGLWAYTSSGISFITTTVGDEIYGYRDEVQQARFLQSQWLDIWSGSSDAER